MHIVLSGYYGFNNVGDEAILFSIIHALKSRNSEVEITVLSNNPESTKKTYNVHAVNRWNLKDINNVIKNADALISGGGSLLQDATGLKSIPYYTGIMKIAKWHHVPVYIYAQGMGPIKRGISKLLVRNALKTVAQITVRDQASKTLLEDIGVKNPISIVPDPVIGLNGRSFKETWTKEIKITGPIITVSVRDWPTTTPYKKKIADSLDAFARDGYSVVFVPMHGEHDEAVSNETAKLMAEKSFIAPYDASIEEKIAIIGKSKLLIGMRLHSLIFAAIHYIPFVALSYDPKIDAFAEICKQPVAGNVAGNDWDSTSLIEIARQTLAKETLQIKLESIIKNMQNKALETPAVILEELSGKTLKSS